MGRGRPGFPHGSTARVVLTSPPPPGATARRLRGSHPLRPAFPRRSAATVAFDPPVGPQNRGARHDGAYNPGPGIGPIATQPGPVWAPPRSLATTGGIVSVPRGTEMFQFPRLPSRNQGGMPGHHPRRIAPFGRPRIKGCTRLPAAFRSVPRPSSAVGAKASTTCACYLAPHPRPRPPGHGGGRGTAPLPAAARPPPPAARGRAAPRRAPPPIAAASSLAKVPPERERPHGPLYSGLASVTAGVGDVK